MSEERERLCRVIVDIVLEHGHDGASEAAAARRAGLSEDAFYAQFESFDQAAVEIYRRNTAEFNGVVRSAYEGGEGWRDSLRAAAYGAARYIRDNPRWVRFGTVEMFRAGDMAQVERERQLHGLIDLIDAGRQELDDPESLDRTTAEATFGAIYESVVKEVSKGSAVGAVEAVPGLMYIAVRPYLGHAIAAEELTVPAPPEPAQAIAPGEVR
jgi:AcrR family transcriptional regulator